MGIKKKWYDVENLLTQMPDCQYYIIFGQRSNGKSYSCGQRAFKRFIEHGEQFAIVKRYNEDIKKSYMENMFSHFDKWLLDEYNLKVRYYQRKWYLYDASIDSPKLVDCDVCGYAFSLNNAEHYKSIQYPKISTVIFEEFMATANKYVNEEIQKLLSIISTIRRDRENFKVFMLANAISKYSPYTQALGISLHLLKKGEIVKRVFEYKNPSTGITEQTTFAIERCSNNVSIVNEKAIISTTKSGFSVFGNSAVGNMVTTGDFETGNYNCIVDNVSFQEHTGASKPSLIFTRKDRTDFILIFLNYSYRIYVKTVNGKWVIGFRSIERKDLNRRKGYIFIAEETFKTTSKDLLISNVQYMDNNNKNLAVIIKRICRALVSGTYVVQSNDDGENVLNALSLVGLRLERK